MTVDFNDPASVEANALNQNRLLGLILDGVRELHKGDPKQLPQPLMREGFELAKGLGDVLFRWTMKHAERRTPVMETGMMMQAAIGSLVGYMIGLLTTGRPDLKPVALHQFRKEVANERLEQWADLFIDNGGPLDTIGEAQGRA